MIAQARRELTRRQQQVLSAVVQEYIQTAAPVGSKTIQKKYGLPVSSATIRNEMGRLTEQGYLSQPHTSAGRIPEEKAYRSYINQLGATSLPPISQLSWVRSQYRRITTDMDTILRTTTRILSQLTQQPALMEMGSDPAPSFTEVHATPISAQAIRITCACSDGSRRELVVKSSQPLTAEHIRELDQALATQLAGTKVTDLGLAGKLPQPEDISAPASLLQSIAMGLTSGWRGQVYVDGMANMLSCPEFQHPERLRVIMEMLAEEAAVHRMLQGIGDASEVAVVIGSEHGSIALADCSLVAKRFGVPSPYPSASGTVGVLGPMRMPYDQMMSAVSCIADHAGQLLSQSMN